MASATRGTVRVRGLNETLRAFRYIGGDLNKEVRAELKQVGEIVRRDASVRASAKGYGARTQSGYRTRVRQKGVAVEQSRRKTTGKRPEFGALQMRKVLIPARSDNYDEVIKGLEKALDNLAREAGF